MLHLLFLFGIYNRFQKRILDNFPLSTGESGNKKIIQERLTLCE